MRVTVALGAACVSAWVPPHLEDNLKGVKFSGGLANPLTDFPEARWEFNVGEMPHQRYPNLLEYHEAMGDGAWDDDASAADDNSPTWTHDSGSDDVAAAVAAVGNDKGKDADAKNMTSSKGGDESDGPCDSTPCDNLPKEFSWYAFHGQGLLSHNINQHLPKYCADCWLVAASSMLADRIKIARYAAGGNAQSSAISSAQRSLGLGAKMLFFTQGW